MKFSQLPIETIRKLQLNAGLLLDDFKPETGTIGNILGATSGGMTFSDSPSYSDIAEDIDNAGRNLKQGKRKDTREVKLAGNLVNITAAGVQMLLGAADVNTYDITPRSDLTIEDFADVWWVGDYGENGGFLALHLKNALNTTGFQIQSNDDGKDTFSFEFTGHYSIADSSEPFEVYLNEGNVFQSIIDEALQKGLRVVYIPEGTALISNNEFSGQDDLGCVICPDSIVEIESGAFNGCTNLLGVKFKSNDDFISLPQNLFNGCKNLKRVDIPESITDIQTNAFSGCENLTEIFLPTTIETLDGCFVRCYKLKRITLPNSLTWLGRNTFKSCNSLKSIVIPTEPRTSCFEGCEKLETVVIKSGVTYIDEFVFSDCAMLSEITIPVSVSAIGKNAFRNCSALTDVFYSGTAEQWAGITIGTNNGALTNATIHYSEGS